jgi:hypothetical protein
LRGLGASPCFVWVLERHHLIRLSRAPLTSLHLSLTKGPLSRQ